MIDAFELADDRVWSTELAFQYLRDNEGCDSKRTAERRLHSAGLLPPELASDTLVDELNRTLNSVVLEWSLARARAKRQLVLFAQIYRSEGEQLTLHVNDARGGRYWVSLPRTQTLTRAEVLAALARIQAFLGKHIVVYPHGEVTSVLRDSAPGSDITIETSAHPPVLSETTLAKPASSLTTHLKRLEAESIDILREAVAESENPVMMYSVGKDSSVMLHLARKAFYPAPPPFPLLHVDTRWKFQEMYLIRDRMAAESGMNLLVHVNPDAIAKDINPFDHGSAVHTDITKTEGLKQALDLHGFDVVFGGARRDEEKSRAKERIFSFRTKTHRWDPKNQRPELWNLYNAKKSRGESIRVFPISNWTELDIWQYIYQESIPVVPLYFAKKRPVVERDGMLLMVDDSRFRMMPDEQIVEKVVRFRTLGCYPLTGAIESAARNVPEIILELLSARSSERQGRAIDSDASASMEKKKQEGYF